MANGKKSVLIYCDLIHTVELLTNEQAGILFKHLLAYVNDKGPVLTDPMLQVAFEPIRQSLKRDLRKYEEIRTKRSEAGKASALSKQQVLTSVNKGEQAATNSTVNDSVSVSVIDSDKKKNTFIPPSALDVLEYFKLNGYTEDAAKRAFEYYHVANWVDSKGKKVRNWKQKMQANWFKPENKENQKSGGMVF